MEYKFEVLCCYHYGVRFVIIRLSYIKAPEYIMAEFHVLTSLIVSCGVDEIIIMGFGMSFKYRRYENVVIMWRHFIAEIGH